MKFTKLSLIATLAISSAFAGGDIAPVEPVVEAPAPVACNSNTTINGKAVLYSYTWDGYGDLDWYKGESSALGAAVTLDVSHKIMDNMTANITAVGFTNLTNQFMEGEETGAFLNVANITNTMIPDTTLILGRQLLDTPMISGFDWLLAPGSFEAYTVVNKSISNLTLVGSYITEYRPNDGGTDFIDIDGENWALGAAYSDAFDVSVWYYNVDAWKTDGFAGSPYTASEDYTQVYADAGYNFGPVALAGQYIDTDYDTVDDSTAYGIKVSGSLAGFDLMAAYVNVDDNVVGYVDNDAIYTSMWNTLGSWSVGDSYKFEAATEFYGVSASAAYAYFEYDNMQAIDPDYDEGSEFDLVLGYGITDCISVDAIYTSTDYGEGEGDDQAMELIATYKF
jgi:hypothetical protein